MWPLSRKPGLVRLFALVALPFAAGYYLSYLFRTINALIGPLLTDEMAIGPQGLGLLTSVYFLTFTLFQLPLGVLLDRFGPRRVQAALLVIAAGGAAVFAIGGDTVTLVAGRALIGVGVSGALLAGLKTIALWFPKERVPLANGAYIMIGTMGAVTATVPAEAALEYIGWRAMFLTASAATLAVAAVIYLFVPEKPRDPVSAAPEVRLLDIYRDGRFWRLAPLSSLCIGTAWAVQGLWAAPWLAEVAGLARSMVVLHLLVMACTLSAGAFLLGLISDRLRRRGVHPTAMFAGAALTFIAVQGAIVLGAPLPSIVLWGAFSVFGSMTVLGFGLMAEMFPKESIGRANSALNLMHNACAFLIQYLIGAILGLFSVAEHRYTEEGFAAAFVFLLVLQAAGLIWFLHPKRALHRLLARTSPPRLRRSSATWSASAAVAPRSTWWSSR